MLKLRKSEDRGKADHGWLKSYHSFSFANYYDANCMGFAVLRVINEDYIKGGQGFATHPHNNMEIITYIIAGVLEHKDSMGNSGLIRPFEVQRMSAGTGVLHSEFNHLSDQETHLLQIWILPKEKNVNPSYAQKSYQQEIEKKLTTGFAFILVVSKEGRDGSLSVNQDLNFYVGKAKTKGESEFQTAFANQWIQVVEGTLEIDQTILSAGDGLAISNVQKIKINYQENSHFILMDMTSIS